MNGLATTHDLTFSYGMETVVRGVDLNIGERSIYGFVGPNGAGKSTTIKLLLGLLKPHRGTVRIFGSDLAEKRTDILRQIGSLVEVPSLYPHLTAEENLDVVRRIRRVPSSRITAVLESTGIAAAKKKKVRHFSLGMKQRLGIALALLHSPRLLILDEPINGLDPEGIQEFRLFLKRLVAEDHVTVLLSSHILSELEQVVTHVGIIAHGAMKFQGTLAELQQRQRGRLLISVSDAGKAAALLRSKGIRDISEENGSLSLFSVAAPAAAEINAHLVHGGIDVFALHFQQPNLESVFLDLIQSGESA